MAENNNRNKLLVPGADNAVDQMKTEIANEFDVQLGADTTARDNGKVGGEMVKQMIQIAEESMANRRK
ncbi:MAG TPA: alpha/beta-type small acid-soluble spore protein [Virgibacillus sp.]|nr:alpha/beta-type small acid-soluble spore protein [Virgibacillus sp.]HLR69061.1 alpha/beta-type small acid-soluble spore protein [Virgibacillus sp.]